MTRLVCFLLFMLAPIPALADAIDDLPPGTWYEIPDSHMEAVFPTGIDGDPRAVVYAWGGATVDTARERLLLWGGGHRDYAGNEVYAFSLRTLRWERLTEPSVVDTTTEETYGDGRPVSRHTYSGLVYLPALDVMEARGGSRYQTGNGTDATWRLHLSDLRWERIGDIPDWDYFCDVSVYDPTTGHVFHRHNRGIYEFDPAAQTYEQLHAYDGGLWQTNSSGAFDPETRTILYIGDTVDLFHVDTGEYEADRVFEGDAAAVDSAPGLAYDASLHRFISWHGGPTIYSLNREAGRWEAHVGGGTPPGPRPDIDGGRLTFGRFRYVPSRNVYVLVNSPEQNVFVYRMAEGPGIPPDPLPDAGTTDAGATALDPDAGVAPGVDAGRSDAGEAVGCGCGVGRRGGGSGLFGLLLLALLRAR